MEVACKHCGTKADVNSLLAATQLPCSKCRKPILGDAEPVSYDKPPPLHKEPATEATHAPAGPPRKLDTSGAIIGALMGVVAALGLGILERWLPDWVTGPLLGALAGVLIAPLLMVSTLLAAIRSDASMPFSLGDVASQGMWDSLATAINERRYGKMAIGVLVFVIIGMGVGALIGIGAREATGALVVFGAIGAAILGAGIGFFLRPTAVVEEEPAAAPSADEKPAT